MSNSILAGVILAIIVLVFGAAYTVAGMAGVLYLAGFLSITFTLFGSYQLILALLEWFRQE